VINCLIVEDEPLASDILQDYVKLIPFLQLKGVCTDAVYALEIIRREKIDLILLDIHLPGMKGLDFLRTLQNPPAIILTTAYHEYALQGYEFSVVDYLLKPIEFERFVAAVNKVQKLSHSTTSKQTLLIHADRKNILIPINEILYIESQKEYIRIQTETTSFTSRYAISKIESELDSRFLRVHRSFIVLVDKIRAFDDHTIEIPGKSIPIGGNYREEVAIRLSTLFKSS
jgi:DNA-binding LytR/AlgR family response regulator